MNKKPDKKQWERDLRLLRRLHRMMWKNRLRALIKAFSKDVISITIHYILFLLFMGIIAVSFYFSIMTAADDLPPREELVRTTALPLLMFYYLMSIRVFSGSLGRQFARNMEQSRGGMRLASDTSTGTNLTGTIFRRSLTVTSFSESEEGMLFPAPVSRNGLVRFRLGVINRQMGLLGILAGLYVTSALNLGGELPLYRSLAVMAGLFLNFVLSFSLLSVMFSAKRVIRNPGRLLLWRIFKYGYLAAMLSALWLWAVPSITGGDLPGSGALESVVFVLLWPVFLPAFLMWSPPFQAAILVVVMIATVLILNWLTLRTQCSLLSESYVEPPHIRSGLVQRIMERRHEKDYHPIMEFGNGAAALETKNLLALVRIQLFPMLIIFLQLGIFVPWILRGEMGMPGLGLFIVLTCILIFLGLGFTRHISLEGSQLDILKMVPDTGKRIFWSYVKWSIIFIVAISMIIIPIALLAAPQRALVNVGIILLIPSFSLTMVVVGQEGFIKKMRFKETADIMAGKMRLAMTGYFWVFYFIMLFPLLTALKLDLAAVLIYLSLVSLFFLGMSVLRIGAFMEQFMNPRLPRRYLRELGTTTATILVALSFLVVPWPFNFDDYPVTLDNGNIPEKDVEEISGYTLLAEGEYTYDLNLVVRDGGTLEMLNVTLLFDTIEGRDDDDYGPVGLFVEKGGSIVIENSTITTTPLAHEESDKGFRLEIYGNCTARNSTFDHLHGYDFFMNYNGGFEIYSDNVLLENCTVTGGMTNGLFIGECSPVIRGCRIYNNSDDGIELFKAKPVIENTDISINEWGMVLQQDSDAVITNCVVRDNWENGISMENSHPSISNCTIRNNGGYGISTVVSDPVLRDNTVTGNDYGNYQNVERRIILRYLLGEM